MKLWNIVRTVIAFVLLALLLTVLLSETPPQKSTPELQR